MLMVRKLQYKNLPKNGFSMKLSKFKPLSEIRRFEGQWSLFLPLLACLVEVQDDTRNKLQLPTPTLSSGPYLRTLDAVPPRRPVIRNEANDNSLPLKRSVGLKKPQFFLVDASTLW